MRQKVLTAKNNFYSYPILVLVAMIVVVSPSIAMSINDNRRLAASAIKPMIGGPNKNPRYPIVETAANATPGDNFLDRPAAL